MKNLFFAIVLCGSFMLFGCEKSDERLNIIPLPAEIEQLGGELVLDSLKVFAEEKGENVQFLLDTSLKMEAEGYDLEVSKNGIVLKAKTEAGLFYGEQTLKQLYSNGKFSCVKIKDNPRFSYRGMHLDVSRHFFEKEEIFKLIDAFSFYKINNLHLHLTDAGGWRIQIDKYPKLTSHGAFRTESDWRKWWDGKDRKYLLEGTEGAYGGYYTKDDIKEIVAYAAKRHINILPEIEFPGHSEEVFFAYPNLCCTGKPYTNGDFCIGNKDSYTFLKDVLTEIIELFPSEYIHIGGDEAGKQGWKECKKCKALMKQEGLKDVNELQSYFIKKANEFLKSKGRKLIGWDEILEGGLESDAAIMCWRGEETGLKAAKKGHKVVMTPGKYLYFDFYQADPKTQPYAIGGYTPIKKVYNYNPAPKDSLSFEQQKNILGVQANTWTEYIPDNNHLEYMMFPRALAVAEMGWTPQENRCWEDFKKRVNFHIPNLKAKGINSFTLSNELETTMVVDTIKKEIAVYLDSEKYPAEIRYTTNGSVPNNSSALYKDKIVVKDSARIVAGVFIDGELQGEVTCKKVDYHRGINKAISFNSRLYKGYMAGGVGAVVDGYRGGLTYLDGRWQGYLDNLDCVVDMGEKTIIKSVSSKFMQLIGPGVFLPTKVEVLVSGDGVEFVSIGEKITEIPNTDPLLIFEEYDFVGEWECRYVKLKAERGNGGFIFLDEIVIW